MSGSVVRPKLKYRRGYIGGTFDLLHRGHHALFASARVHCEEIVVSLNTDAFAERYKRRPVQPLGDRLLNISQLRTVDLAIVNNGCEDSRPAILRSGADCLIHGSDWQGDSLLSQMGLTQAWLDEHGIAVLILPYTPWTSTTALLDEYHAQAVPCGH